MTKSILFWAALLVTSSQAFTLSPRQMPLRATPRTFRRMLDESTETPASAGPEKEEETETSLEAVESLGRGAAKVCHQCCRDQSDLSHARGQTLLKFRLTTCIFTGQTRQTQGIIGCRGIAYPKN